MTSAAAGSARLIKETLDSVVAPAVRDALVSAALDECGLSEVPGEPDEFRSFVEGALRNALVQGLGPELAESIVEELDRMTQLTPRDLSSVNKPVRRTSRSPAPRSISPPPRRNTPTHRRSLSPKSMKASTLPAGMAPPPSSDRRRDHESPTDPNAPTLAPPPPTAARPIGRLALTPPPPSAPLSGPVSRPSAWGSDEYPMGAAGTLGLPGAGPESTPAAGRPYVLVASSDETLLRRLTPWLDNAAELALVANVRELVRDLEALGDARVAVIVDCRRPSIRPTAVAALADELPANVSVVLWAASPEQERGVLAVSPLVSRWVVLGAETRPKELARRCADLVG